MSIQAFVGVNGIMYVWSDIADSWPYVRQAHLPLGMLPEKLRNLAHNLLALREQSVPLYAVTGVDRGGKRFSFKVRGAQAFCYNLWRGNVWQINEQTGKRTRVKSYYN